MGNLSTMANYVEQLQLPQKHVLLNIIDSKVDYEMKEVKQSIIHLENRIEVRFTQMLEQFNVKSDQIREQYNAECVQIREQMNAKFALINEQTDNKFVKMQADTNAKLIQMQNDFNAWSIQNQTKTDLEIKAISMQCVAFEQNIEKRFNMILWMFGALSTLLTAGFLKSIFF
jgi:hypothetical protein